MMKLSGESAAFDRPTRAEAVARAMAKRALAACSYWLLKSEPADYSIAMMQKEGRTVWDGVRNVVARKHLRAMAIGDRCLFYHSSCGKNVGVVGVVECVREAYADPVDAAWAVVDVAHVETWPSVLTLEELKAHKEEGGALAEMTLFRMARLSVQPVTPSQFEFICSLKPDGEADDGAVQAKNKKRKT